MERRSLFVFSAAVEEDVNKEASATKITNDKQFPQGGAMMCKLLLTTVVVWVFHEQHQME